MSGPVKAGTVGDLGEWGIIRLFEERFPGGRSKNVTGIQDDAAVIPIAADKSLIWTTDLLIEGTHFRRDWTSAPDLGAKSLAVNISDIAAMGAKARDALLSVALPPDLETEWLKGFIDGFADLAGREGVFLLGGDTARSPGPVFINVTVLGEAAPQQLKFRSGAKPGDLLCVTGTLGDSAAGLELLQRGVNQAQPWGAGLVRAHTSPRPQTAEGVWLAGFPEVHAMMDISDGLLSDVRHIEERSRCTAEIDVDRLPVSEAVKAASAVLGICGLDLALNGGEDYRLLAAVDGEYYEKIAAMFLAEFARPLVKVGILHPQGQRRRLRFQGRDYTIQWKGFEHFKS